MSNEDSPEGEEYDPEPRRGEGWCDDCHQSYGVWFAPNSIWNLVVGTIANPRGDGIMLCPTCFMKRAEKRTPRALVWCLIPEDVSAKPYVSVVGPIQER